MSSPTSRNWNRCWTASMPPHEATSPTVKRRASVANLESRERVEPEGRRCFPMLMKTMPSQSVSPTREGSVARLSRLTAPRSPVDTKWHGVCLIAPIEPLEGSTIPMDEFEQKRVLVVEDNGRLRATVGELLRWQGYRVSEAADGAEALTVAF